jgi:uncharacterized RDD family membrane protein YckC
MEYAGFWRRVGASVIDGILLNVVGGIVIAISAAISDVLVVIAYVVYVAALFLYYAIMESSSYQATVGKIALGIQVTDLSGNRIGFGRALGRNLAEILSALILLIGYLLVAFTEKKQALHDMIAGTLVVKRAAGPAQTAA